MDTQVAALIGGMVGILVYLIIGVVLLGFLKSFLLVGAVGLIGGLLAAGYAHFRSRDESKDSLR